MDGHVPLRDLMRLRGASLPHPLTRTGADDVVDAVQRCLACGNTAKCDACLTARNAEGYGIFCANAAYIERLRRGLSRRGFGCRANSSP